MSLNSYKLKTWASKETSKEIIKSGRFFSLDQLSKQEKNQTFEEME